MYVKEARVSTMPSNTSCDAQNTGDEDICPSVRISRLFWPRAGVTSLCAQRVLCRGKPPRPGTVYEELCRAAAPLQKRVVPEDAVELFPNRAKRRGQGFEARDTGRNMGVTEGASLSTPTRNQSCSLLNRFLAFSNITSLVVPAPLLDAELVSSG